MGILRRKVEKNRSNRKATSIDQKMKTGIKFYNITAI